jgi:DNA-binding transcriptional ArsR family regulator
MVATNHSYTDAEVRDMADQFKALAHPVRLKIVLHLTEGECCVCELVDLGGIGISAVSRHLSVLKTAGLVADEKRGQKVFYRLLVPWVSSCTDCLSSIAKARNSG